MAVNVSNTDVLVARMVAALTSFDMVDFAFSVMVDFELVDFDMVVSDFSVVGTLIILVTYVKGTSFRFYMVTPSINLYSIQSFKPLSEFHESRALLASFFTKDPSK